MIKLKNNVLKILIAMLMVIALIIPVASYATDAGSGVTVITPGTPTPAPASPVINTTPTPNNRPTTPSPVVSPTPVNQTKLPQTGIGDYTALIVVTIVLGASAMFAYVKIKQYKDIK